MEQLMNKVLAMKPADRVAFAHGLMMNLEKSKDITQWQFWERQTVKEIMEENLSNRRATEAEVDKVMAITNSAWNNEAQMQNDWNKFSDLLAKTMRKNGINDAKA